MKINDVGFADSLGALSLKAFLKEMKSAPHVFKGADQHKKLVEAYHLLKQQYDSKGKA